MENKNQKPKHLLVCKILGVAILVTAITLIILANTACAEEIVLGDWHTGDTAPNMGMLGLGTFLIPASIVMLFIGFHAEISKMAVKSAKYTQNQNKEDLTDIANTNAEIMGGAITSATKAIKKGIENTKYCIHCGAEIDASANFCSKCGKEVK